MIKTRKKSLELREERDGKFCVAELKKVYIMNLDDANRIF